MTHVICRGGKSLQSAASASYLSSEAPRDRLPVVPESLVPGLLHDHCSAFRPMAVGSPFLNSLGLGR